MMMCHLFRSSHRRSKFPQPLSYLVDWDQVLATRRMTTVVTLSHVRVRMINDEDKQALLFARDHCRKSQP